MSQTEDSHDQVHAVAASRQIRPASVRGVDAHRRRGSPDRAAVPRDLPFETWTGSTYAVNKAVNRVLGPAYLVNEVIMGCVAQAFKAAGKRRLADLLDRVDRAEAEALFAALRARGTMPRFHPLRDFVAYERILAPLVAADLVWFKQEDGPATIGLNRAYD